MLFFLTHNLPEQLIRFSVNQILSDQNIYSDMW